MTARRNLEISDIGLKYTRNQTLPGVDLTAYYTSAGAGGTTVLQRRAGHSRRLLWTR